MNLYCFFILWTKTQESLNVNRGINFLFDDSTKRVSILKDTQCMEYSERPNVAGNMHYYQTSSNQARGYMFESEQWANVGEIFYNANRNSRLMCSPNPRTVEPLDKVHGHYCHDWSPEMPRKIPISSKLRAKYAEKEVSTIDSPEKLDELTALVDSGICKPTGQASFFFQHRVSNPEFRTYLNGGVKAALVALNPLIDTNVYNGVSYTAIADKRNRLVVAVLKEAGRIHYSEDNLNQLLRQMLSTMTQDGSLHIPPGTQNVPTRNLMII